MSDSTPLGSLVGRLFSGGASRQPVEPGSPFVGTGLAAVAALAERGGARLVVGEALAGDPALVGASGGGVATALGLALGGERVMLFLADHELAENAALAREAVRRRAPFVLCLASGTLAGAQVAAAAGMAVLLPGTVGEAVDHVLAAGLAAESALVPVVVALDRETIAFAVEECGLPESALVGRLLGHPADSVHSSGSAENELFGEHRRRVPRWHDAARALRLGGEMGAAGARAAFAGEQLFFARDLARRLDDALSTVAAATGRPLPAISGQRLNRVDLGIVACGGTAATAEALAGELGRSGPRLGVLALRRFAPMPETELVALCDGCRRLAVVERLDGAGEHGALAQAVGAALARLAAPVQVATLGLVGNAAPLFAADLAAGCRALVERFRPLVVLGLAATASEAYPKRRALHDQHRRELPGWDDLAARAGSAIDLRPKAAVTLVFERLRGDRALMRDAARFLGSALGGHLHSRLGIAPPAAGLPERDWLIWAPAPFAYPGEPPTSGHLFQFVGLPTGAARGRFFGALAAWVASQAGRELKERELRAAGKECEVDLEEILAGFAASEEILRPFQPARDREVTAPLPLVPPQLPGRGPEAGALGDSARFWDQIGLPIGEGAAEQLVADATLAVGALPAGVSPVGAAAFGGRPEFLADLCTGCAACWTLCPHSALIVNAQPIERILTAAIAAVGRTAAAGGSAEALRRFVPKLAERLAFEATDKGGGRFGDWLESAGATVLASAGLTAERLVEARSALARVASEVGALQVAATPGFFLSASGSALPEAALLALAVDPDRCTGCGLCIAECAPGALVPGKGSGFAEVAAERAISAAMRLLPASESSAVERVADEARLGPLAAALLTPGGVAPLAGFDDAAPGSASRLAVRQAFALLARALAPRRAARRGELSGLSDRLAEAIHATLGKALPDGDLTALARGLESAGSGSVDFGELATRLAGAVEGERVNVARLGRLVEAARAVADLGARLGEASAETSPLFSVVVGPGEALAWARRFPDNPFGVPATVAVTAPLALARGLALAEAERAITAARVLRRARLELERPQEAIHAAERLASLAWSDLDDAERAVVSPLVVLIDEAAGGAEIGEAFALLAAPFPMAVFTLAPAPAGEARSPWWALAAAAEEGIVAHASIAGVAGVAGGTGSAPLAAAMTAFAAGSGGALVRILAPAGGPAAAISESVLDRARRAVEAREFPLGCRIAAVPSNSTALRVDPFAVRSARAAEHEAELAAAEARHRQELAKLEGELRVRLAERLRVRLIELAGRAAGERTGTGTGANGGMTPGAA
ncbi:MAG: 4Fe-4S binding protein [Thermoanaerobaculia bacterium]